MQQYLHLAPAAHRDHFKSHITPFESFDYIKIFDKTGTLTLGEPWVEEIASTEGIDKEEVLSCAASAEQHCTHPLARAILKAAQYAKVVVRGSENAFHEIGLGVRATVEGSLVEVGSVTIGDNSTAFPRHLRECLETSYSRGVTPLVVYRDKAPVGLLNVTDQVRPTIHSTIKQLFISELIKPPFCPATIRTLLTLQLHKKCDYCKIKTCRTS